MIPLVYHPRYNITAFGLERLHPFDSRKYRRIHDALVARGLRRPRDFVRPRPATRSDLLRVHTEEYLRSLRSPDVAGRHPGGAGRPPPARLGDRLADLAAHAVRHRAGRSWPAAWPWSTGSPSTSAAATTMRPPAGAAASASTPTCPWRRRSSTTRARSGGCWSWTWTPTRATARPPSSGVGTGPRSTTSTRRDIFPARKEPEDYPLPVGPGLTGAEYLGIVRDTLPGALDAVRPDLVVYNAGSDPFVGDPLARYRLTAGDLAERDLLVVDMVRERGIPLAMVLSGGYSAESWKIHADAIEGILTRFDRG